MRYAQPRYEVQKGDDTITNTYKQSIYDTLKEQGYNEIAIGALMGNMEAESGCIPNRVEGDFLEGYKKSAEYTDAVNNGSISRETFMNDGKGYGLCQWTYPTRKAKLYDMAKETGFGIGSYILQLYFLEQELTCDFPLVGSALKNATNLYDAVAIVLRKFEMPYDQSDAVCTQRTLLAQNCLNSVSKNSTAKPVELKADEPKYRTFTIQITLTEDSDGFRITDFKTEERFDI